MFYHQVEKPIVLVNNTYYMYIYTWIFFLIRFSWRKLKVESTYYIVKVNKELFILYYF